MVGGATYEEALTVAIKNKETPNCNIVLGSGFIHNSQTFLAEADRVFSPIPSI